MAFAEDLAPFFADFGVAVVFGGLSTTALFDQPGVEVLNGIGIANDYAITYASGELSGLERNSTIKVDGDAYLVREVFPIDDGALSRATLEPA